MQQYQSESESLRQEFRTEIAKPGEWFNTERSATIQRDFRKLWSHCVYSTAAMAAVYGFSLIYSVPFVTTLFGMSLCLGLATAYSLAALGLLHLRRNNRVRELARISEGFSRTVEIDIAQEGIITGSDIGEIWIENNALHFSGEQTSFVLGGQQIYHVPTVTNPSRIGKTWSPPIGQLTIGILHPCRKVTLVLSGFRSKRGSPSEWQEIIKWSETRPPSSAPLQMVPLRLNPKIDHYVRGTIVGIIAGQVGMFLFFSALRGTPTLMVLASALHHNVCFIFHYRSYRRLMRELAIEALDR